MNDTNTGNPPAGSPAAAPAPAPTAAPAGAPAGAPSPSPAPSPSGAPAGAPAAADSIAGGGTPNKDVAAPADFPTDWRTKLAGADAKELARLERFATPGDMYKSYRALEAKLSSGELVAKNPLPANATDEQKAEFRKANGIPETPDKYDIKLSDGLVVGENDKPLVDSYTKFAHEKNLTPEMVSQGVEWFLKMDQAKKAENIARDKAFHNEALDDLRATYGAEFEGNIALMGSMLDGLGEETKNAILAGRTAEGKLMGDDPQVLKGLVRLAYELNPTGKVTPNVNTSQIADIEKEMKTIESRMGTTSYTQSDRARYGELETMMERTRKSKAA